MMNHPRNPPPRLPPAEFKTGVILLAAGASSRMGRPKLLLPWNGTSILAHLIATWNRLGAQEIAVVTSGPESPVARELVRLSLHAVHRIDNPKPDDGMFSSIQSAARWAGWPLDLTHWIVSLGDQPHVRRETLANLLEFARENSACICQPEWQGRAKHPVVLPRAVFQELASAQVKDFKRFLESRREARRLCESDDAGLELDLDHPSDYESALRLSRGHEGGAGC